VILFGFTLKDFVDVAGGQDGVRSHRTWEYTDIVDTLEEALGYLPEENKGGEFDPLSVEIVDGATGNMEACGHIRYPQWGSYTGYMGTRRKGWGKDGPFDSHTDEEWDAIDKKARIKALKWQIAKLQPDTTRLEQLKEQLETLEGTNDE
jgi:hypothetical protein